MSSMLPDGWTVSKLGEHVKLQGGNAFQSSNFIDSGIPIVRISNIKNGVVDLSNSVFYQEFQTFQNFLVVSGDILLAMSGATTGKVGRYSLPFKSYLNQRVGRFQIKQNNPADMDFIYQLVRSRAFSENTLIDAVGGAQPNISSAQVEGVFYQFPPLAEQKKIASILTSVDDVIENTQKQIDKLQDLKKATMNELLTKGIGHTEFKDSELGRIPQSWTIVTLGGITIESAFGPRFSSDLYREKGEIGCIRTTDIDKNWNINYDTVPRAALNLEDFSSHILEDGDMLITRSGTCGLVDIFRKQDIPMVAGAFLIRFRLKESIMPMFLRLVMMEPMMQERIQSLAAGGVQKNLSGTNLKSLLISLPKCEEQRHIVSIVESIMSNIAFLIDKLHRTQSLKKSLMQDLLTGKVRVTVN